MKDNYESPWDNLEPGTFDNLWLEIVDYADDCGLSASYIEEEFVIEGEFIKEQIHFKKTPV